MKNLIQITFLIFSKIWKHTPRTIKAMIVKKIIAFFIIKIQKNIENEIRKAIR